MPLRYADELLRRKPVQSHTRKSIESMVRARDHDDASLSLALRDTGLVPSSLETDPSIIYVLRWDSQIIYCNRAWDKFALENGGDALIRANILGTTLQAILPQPIFQFYQHAFNQVLSTGTSWAHDYECSSSGLYRRFRMQVLRLSGPHLLVMNSLKIQETHRSDVLASDADATYIDEHGILTLCCNCRRALRVDSKDEEIWNWVPRFIEKPPKKVSHGLCKICYPSFIQA